MLYLISSGKYMKVGYVKSEYTFIKRMKQYVCHNPNFTLVGIIEGGLDKEYQFHKMFVTERFFRSEFYEFDNGVYNDFINDKSFKSVNIEEIFGKIDKDKKEKRELKRIEKKELFEAERIKRKYGKKRSNIEKLFKNIYKDLKLQVGNTYCAIKMKEELKDIYNKYRLNKIPKLSNLYEVKKTTKRENGKIVKAYRIIGYKFK